jgi:hypothetical protein
VAGREKRVGGKQLCDSKLGAAIGVIVRAMAKDVYKIVCSDFCKWLRINERKFWGCEERGH